MENLENLLRQRRAVPPAPALARRILLAAASACQRPALDLSQALKDAFAAFSLPRPALALASAVAIGFVVGIGTAADGGAQAFSGDDNLFSDEAVL
jgi:hypothetical protein